MVLGILLLPNGITSYKMIVTAKNLEFYILNYSTFSFCHLAVPKYGLQLSCRNILLECTANKTRYMDLLAGKLISKNAQILKVLWQRLMVLKLVGKTLALN